MSEIADVTAIDAVLQAAHCLHNQFMSKLRYLQRTADAAIIIDRDPSLKHMIIQLLPFEMVTEMVTETMRLERDIDAKYNEALRMCHNPADTKILYDFSKGKQEEKMSLVYEILENQISKIASNEELADVMKDFINYVRSLDCPCCRSEKSEGGRDQEMIGVGVV